MIFPYISNLLELCLLQSWCLTLYSQGVPQGWPRTLFHEIQVGNGKRPFTQGSLAKHPASNRNGNFRTVLWCSPSTKGGQESGGTVLCRRATLRKKKKIISHR